MGGKRTERLADDRVGIARAVEILAAGGLVAVPTETVYGLAARADSDAPVANIYRAKGRPDFNPLIVHVDTLEMANDLADFDPRAKVLAQRFWPGPLTLVLPRRTGAPVAAAVTAGLPTIALRMPDHPVLRDILRQLNAPLAAPSANPSGAVSATSAAHVLQGLEGRIDAVIDGGATKCGLESTIVALREGSEWSLLRPGPIDEQTLRELLGPPTLGSRGIEAPGQLASHYSPGKPLRLNATEPAADEFFIGFGSVGGTCSLSPSGDLSEAAARLYACLHEAAVSPLPRAAVARIPDHGIGAAINDRLRRAAA